MRTFATARGEAGVTLERVQAGRLLGGEHRRPTAWVGAPARLGRHRPGAQRAAVVGSSSTSTTVSPAAASTRWVVSSDR